MGVRSLFFVNEYSRTKLPRSPEEADRTVENTGQNWYISSDDAARRCKLMFVIKLNFALAMYTVLVVYYC